MDLVYVTSRFPFGPGEGFIGPEIAAHLAGGAEVRLFPMLPKGGQRPFVRSRASRGSPNGPGRRVQPLLRSAVPPGRRPSSRSARLSRRQPAGPLSRARNLAVLPRAAALIDVIRRRRPQHLHAHWGGASSTVAMIASEVTGTPWSMTLHRWDIRANNLLGRKISSACFTRVISRAGAAEVAAIVPDARPAVIHMGIDIPAEPPAPPPVRPDRIACIATLVAVKNHAGLLDAFSEGLGDRTTALDLVGDGPLRAQLTEHAARLGLAQRVRFLGTLDHGEVMRRLGSHEWSAVVLASEATEESHEGVPVSLMEAMASLVPVVATDSGGTGELVGGGAGLLVPVGDRALLANALRRIATDGELRDSLARAGRRRVAASFDVRAVAAELRSGSRSAQPDRARRPRHAVLPTRDVRRRKSCGSDGRRSGRTVLARRRRPGSGLPGSADVRVPPAATGVSRRSDPSNRCVHRPAAVMGRPGRGGEPDGRQAGRSRCAHAAPRHRRLVAEHVPRARRALPPHEPGERGSSGISGT